MSDSVSLLPFLEPVCGAGLAIAVAYLNLERFRYRKAIREKAQHLLEELKSIPTFSIMEHDEKVELIQNLAGLRDNSVAGTENGTNPGKRPRKKGWSRFLYDVFYRYHVDRWLCVIFGSLCFIGLVLGTMHASGSIKIFENWFTGPIKFTIWSVLFSLGTILPLLFVSGGSWIVRSLSRQAENAYTSCEFTLKKAVGNAQVNLKPKTTRRKSPAKKT